MHGVMLAHCGTVRKHNHAHIHLREKQNPLATLCLASMPNREVQSMLQADCPDSIYQTADTLSHPVLSGAGQLQRMQTDAS